MPAVRHPRRALECDLEPCVKSGLSPAACLPWSLQTLAVSTSAVLLAAQIVQWLRERDDLAHRIALEGQRFAARHLSKPARLCYIRKLLTEFGSLFRWARSRLSTASVYRNSCLPMHLQDRKAAFEQMVLWVEFCPRMTAVSWRDGANQGRLVVCIIPQASCMFAGFDPLHHITCHWNLVRTVSCTLPEPELCSAALQACRIAGLYEKATYRVVASGI